MDAFILKIFPAERWRRNHAQEMYMQTTELFLPTEITIDEWNSIDNEKKVFSGLSSISLPLNVHILTLEDWTSPDR